MLNRLVKLRVGVQYFFRLHTPEKQEEAFSCDEDQLTNEDWAEIERFIKLLAPFEYTTKRLEGNASRHGHEGSHGAVWEVIPTFQHLYNGLLKAQADAKDEEDSQYKIGLNLGVEKMNTYWEKLIYQSRVYIVATMLHPSLNLAWFKCHWKRWPIWISHAEKQFQAFCNLESKRYSDNTIEENEPPSPCLSESPRKRRRLSNHEQEISYNGIFEIDYNYVRNPRARATKHHSEIKDWLSFVPNEDQRRIIQNPLTWWIQELEHNPTRFPILGKMAIDLMACPAMSSECERVFSRAKQLVTNERSKLSAETIEANELQKDWLRKGLVLSWLVPSERAELKQQMAARRAGGHE